MAIDSRLRLVEALLAGGDQGTVSVSGKLDASGENGGSVIATGQNVTVTETAELKADGGAGGKGASDIGGCTGENIVALCDVDADRAAKIFGAFPDVPKFKDYRNMLEKMPEIDALTISTPDHTHAPAAYRAMNLGKHIYVQKPLTHTVAEARLLSSPSCGARRSSSCP